MKNTQAKMFEKTLNNLMKKLDSKQETLDTLQEKRDKVVLEIFLKSDRIQKDIDELSEKYGIAVGGLQAQKDSDYASNNCTYTYTYDYLEAEKGC